MAAWWVDYEQISKVDSTGEYLGAGLFNVSGKKNFLPPAQLLLGFGVMFQISDESKARHLKHRTTDSGATAASSTTETKLETGTTVQSEQADGKDGDEDQENSEHSEEEKEEEHLSTAGTDIAEEPEAEDDDFAKSYTNPLQSKSLVSEIEDLSIKDQNDYISDAAKDVSEGEPEDEEIQDTVPNAPANEILNQSGVEAGPKSTSSATKDNKPSPHVRGKHGKRSKLKTKYAHQDEEDRALAMRLLGSNANPAKNKASEPETQAKREADLAAQKERRRQQHLQTQKSGKEAEEARRARIEKANGVEMLDEAEAAQLDLVDNLVGTPLPGDEILDCLVVCGPWDALGARLRWRVKLQPGELKKGKAVKEILATWQRTIAGFEKKKKAPPPGEGEEGREEEKMYAREAELVKLLRDVEVIGVVPVGKVRIVGGGGTGGGDRGKGGGKGSGKGGGGGKGGKRGRGSKK
jgi:hypothetical protein